MDGSDTYQDRTRTYDGYGRLRTSHAPEQQVDPNNSASTDHTTWDYNVDDTVQKVTDARGASQTFNYNARHLVTGISYAAPAGSAMPVPAAVAFNYDPAGNRLWMTDGLGRVDYSYDTLSRLQSETRQFSGLSGSYTVSYPVYNLAGSPESITDPTGATINYNYDALGRTTAVTGSSFGGVTQYATNMKYRAWGAMKEMSCGNTHTVAAAYNVRLQPTHFEIPGVMAKDYQYQADGRLRSSADLLNNKFDRSYSYDHAGRIKEAFSGPLARGQADTNDRPYKEYNQYDTMDHLVGRVGSRHWSHALPNAGVTDSFVNNRNPNWQYDADGRLTNGSDIQSTFDAAGRAMTVVSNGRNHTQTFAYDGDGRQSKLVEVLTQDDGAGPYTTTTTRYSVSSSVIGKVITELDETGQKRRTFVYRGSQVLAWQQKSGSYEQVSWEYRDPSDASFRVASADGNTDSDRAAEMDSLGSNAGTQNPYTQGHQQWPGQDGNYPGFADLTNPDCQWNGMPFPCEAVNRFKEGGAAAIDYIIPGSELPLTQQGAILPLGLGMFVSEYPYLKPNNEWRPGDAPLEIGWKEAFSLAPQNTAPTVPPGNLIQTMHNLLENPRCSNFISSLINTARQLTGNKPLSYSAKELIGIIAANPDGGYFFSPGYSGGRGGGEAGYGTGAASATIGGQSYSSGTPHAAILAIQVGYALTGLHETIHLAGSGYSDKVLAQAVFAMFGNPNDDPSKVDASARRAVYDYGGIWDKYLQEHCGGKPYNGGGAELGTVP